MPAPVLAYASADLSKASIPLSAVLCFVVLVLLALGLFVSAITLLEPSSVGEVALTVLYTPLPAAAIALVGLIMWRRWKVCMSLSSLACCLQVIALALTIGWMMHVTVRPGDKEWGLTFAIYCIMLGLEAILLLSWSTVTGVFAAYSGAWSRPGMPQWQQSCLTSAPKATVIALIVLGASVLFSDG